MDKRKWYFVLEISVIYFLFITLLDFFFSFCGLTLINNFYHIYDKGDCSSGKCIIFFFSRVSGLIIGLLLEKIKKDSMLLKMVQPFLIVTVGILSTVVAIYHYIIYDIMHGLSDITGWSAACSLIAIFVIIFFCLGLCWKNHNLKQENQILEIREKLELDNLKDMTKALENNRIQMHDMRHHLIILKEYITRKDYFAVEQYLSQLLESYSEIKEEKWTRIHHLDILLNQKKQKAQILNIELKIEADVLQCLPFKETETSVLFGNLLDNAIEACEKIKKNQKYIWIEIRQKKEFLFISIVNPIIQIPLIKNGEIITDKVNREIHGYGLKSINRIVKRYDGVIESKIEDNKYYKVRLSFFNNQNKIF